MEMITTTHHGHPLLPTVKREVRFHHNLPGATVREVLLVEGFDASEQIVIYHNDKLLTVLEWDSVCPVPGDIVNVLVQPAGGGGGGGGSNPIAIVASIALMIVAPYAATAILGDVTATTFAAYAGGFGITYGQILTGVITMVGNALISSIFKPSLPNLTGQSTLGGAYTTPSPTYSLSGGVNRRRPYEVMPVIFGTHRYFPDLAARPYTEYQGDDQFLYQIFHLGLSDASYSDWKIGTTPVSDYSEVTWCWPDSLGRITNFPGNVDTTSGAALTAANGSVTRQTSANTYQIGIDLEAMCYYANDSGGMSTASATINVEYREVGSSTWLPAGDYVTRYTADGYWSFGENITLSEIVYDDYGGFTYQSIAVWNQYFYDGSTDPNAYHNTAIHNESGYRGQWIYQPYRVWEAPILPSYIASARGIDTTPHWVDVSYPHPPRPVQTTREAAITLSGASQKTIRKTLNIPVSSGTYEVRLTRTSSDSNSSRLQNSTSWSVMRSYQADTSNYTDQKRVGLIIRASEQLNGTIQQLSCTATAAATYWDGSAWVTGVTANPAHWYMQFAKGKRNSSGRLLWGCGLSDSQIDLASLHEWATFCSDEKLTIGYVLDSAKTAAEVLALIARCGFASPSWASGKLGVTWDYRNQAPVAMFGMGNILKGSFSVEYVSDKLADEIIVSFVNSSNDWQTDQVRKIVPGVDNPERSTTVDVEGCTDVAMAGKFANYLAAQQYYRRRHITWDCDFEGFVCQRGDVVLLSHDLTQWGYSGRVVKVNGNAVTLDRSVPRSGYTEYFMLKRPDGSLSTYEVEPSSVESDVLTLKTTPVLESGRLDIDHTYSFSPLTTPGKRVKIISVRPISETRVQIVATDENPEFYTAWDGTFTATRPSTLLSNSGPSAYDLNLVEHLKTDTSSALVSTISATWKTNGNYEKANIRYRSGSNPWVKGTVYGTQFTLDVTQTGKLEFEVTPASSVATGKTVAAELWIKGGTLAPNSVTGLTDAYQNGRTVLFWNTVIDPRPVFYELRKGSEWDKAQTLGVTSDEKFTSDGDGMYWVDSLINSPTGKVYSGTPESILIEGAALVANVIATWDEEATSWSGTRTNSVALMGTDLRLIGDELMSSVSQMTKLPSFTYMNGVASVGYYTIPEAHEIDVGHSQVCSVNATYRLTSDSPYNLVSKIPIMSTWPSVKGKYAGLTNATVQIALAQDSGIYADWRNFVPGEYKARKFKLRVKLESYDNQATPILDTFKFSVDVPDRIENGTGVLCVASGLTVTYAKPFQATPNVQITGLDAVVGDDIILSNQTKYGFVVLIKNAGYNVARYINWLAQGY